MPFWIFNDLGTMGLLELAEEGTLVFDVRDINDGKNDTPEYPIERVIRKFCELIKTYRVVNAYGFRMAIRCAAGISRSNAFAAGLIAYNQNIDFEDALNIVKERVGRAMPNMDIIDCVKVALAEARKDQTRSV
jgi:predicted protein tyrosine phosphatase